MIIVEIGTWEQGGWGEHCGSGEREYSPFYFCVSLKMSFFGVFCCWWFFWFIF